jgi:hypothetical protein
MRKLLTVIAVCAALGTGGSASASTLSFVSVNNAAIVFDGNTDTFWFANGTGGWDFEVNLTDPVSGLINANGNITGTFSIGTIVVAGQRQFAPVTGTGSFSFGQGPYKLTADLVWKNIETMGTIGGINIWGSANLSNFVYAGDNPDLLQLVNSPNGGATTVTFQFIPAKSLTDLTTDNTTNRAAYSGTAVPVPEPATALLLGLGFLSVAAYQRRRR